MATPKKATKKKAPAKKAAPRKRVAPGTPKAAIAARGRINEAVRRNQAQAARDAGGDLIVTGASEWKGKADAQGTKLALPSGNVCLAVNKGLMPFIEQGLIPNTLMPLIQEAISSGKGLTKKAAQQAFQSKEGLADVMRMTDAIVVHSVIQPVVLAVPLWTEEDAPTPDAVGQQAPSKKDPANLYIDEVDLNDKMFIFQWVVGGTRDLERFRNEQAAALEDLGPEQDLEAAPE